MALRGFEKFIEGRPAEEVPRIVNRICGICPWMHHTASNKAVDGCFGAQVPPAGRKLRELMQVMAQINDKILHFFFLAAPDFVWDPGPTTRCATSWGSSRPTRSWPAGW